METYASAAPALSSVFAVRHTGGTESLAELGAKAVNCPTSLTVLRTPINHCGPKSETKDLWTNLLT